MKTNQAAKASVQQPSPDKHTGLRLHVVYVVGTSRIYRTIL